MERSSVKALVIASLVGTAAAFSGVPLPAFRAGASSLAHGHAASSAAVFGSASIARGARSGCVMAAKMSLAGGEVEDKALAAKIAREKNLDHVFRNNKMVTLEPPPCNSFSPILKISPPGGRLLHKRCHLRNTCGWRRARRAGGGCGRPR